MNIIFAPQAWEDYCHWQTADRAMVKRVNKLTDDTCRDDPYAGIGKPEKLHYEIDAWSRRIDHEHRLVYRVEGDDVLILQTRYRY